MPDKHDNRVNEREQRRSEGHQTSSCRISGDHRRARRDTYEARPMENLTSHSLDSTICFQCSSSSSETEGTIDYQRDRKPKEILD